MSTSAPSYPRFAPWWTPWGMAIRLPQIIRQPSDVQWLIHIGWFLVRVPGDVGGSHLSEFLAGAAAAPRPPASGHGDADVVAATERIVRLRSPWLKLPYLRRRNTCYVRALALLRYLDAPGRDLKFNIAVEWFDRPGGVLRGHAWVTVDGDVVDGPPEVDSHDELQLITIDVGKEAQRRAARGENVQ